MWKPCDSVTWNEPVGIPALFLFCSDGPGTVPATSVSTVETGTTPVVSRSEPGLHRSDLNSGPEIKGGNCTLNCNFIKLTASFKGRRCCGTEPLEGVCSGHKKHLEEHCTLSRYGA